LNQVFVTGIGLVSALGISLEDSWQNLLAGKTGIKLHQPFPELGIIPLGLIGDKPFDVNTITQMAVNAALKDAELVPPLVDCAVVIGSSRSQQAAWEEFGLYSLNLENWLNTLPHSHTITTAQQIGTIGAVLAPMAACATGIHAIAQAAILIQTGQYHRVIAGAVEAPITPLTIAGFRQMGALANTGAYPFDINREGLVLGEGGAIFVLESAKLAQQRQAKIYGEILGFGLTADAYHSNQPDPQGKGAIAAIQQCLQRSQLTPSMIDYIHTHGTATQLNDRIESMVIQQLFSQEIPISSTKGATGHTLGASAALGIAFSLLALQQKTLPPSVGLVKPEFNLNFVTTDTHQAIQQALCFSFGFGGQNAVIALRSSNYTQN
jgi:3-oxoacyl-[acyl-carrier-protein] synthase II